MIISPTRDRCSLMNISEERKIALGLSLGDDNVNTDDGLERLFISLTTNRMPRYINSKMWTKGDISKLLDMWESSTIQQLMEATNATKNQISYARMALEKAGYSLPKKHKRGVMNSLILEVLKEKGLSTNVPA